jgi:hypothetical protein
MVRIIFSISLLLSSFLIGCGPEQDTQTRLEDAARSESLKERNRLEPVTGDYYGTMTTVPGGLKNVKLEVSLAATNDWAKPKLVAVLYSTDTENNVTPETYLTYSSFFYDQDTKDLAFFNSSPANTGNNLRIDGQFVPANGQNSDTIFGTVTMPYSSLKIHVSKVSP